MTVEPLRAVRDHLSDFVDRAERDHERVVVTRNGRPAAVLIGYDDLAALEETLELLSDPEGVHSARRGAFRVLSEINDAQRLVTVLRVEHRAEVYRPR
ncbi:prevent-host-death family protein [Crossiella equi]|uniref:Antitoxin n=1 Tax=Crossiella equi TaxID=130796 RepID=A0ABS5ALG0_9PSEU|nr:type II toxin-antitoxin system prevent-host-death family antitoxin [Crossiella equi]MBP2477398.1 prevent-host-death family protein [Crossiella equi]